MTGMTVTVMPKLFAFVKWVAVHTTLNGPTGHHVRLHVASLVSVLVLVSVKTASTDRVKVQQLNAKSVHCLHVRTGRNGLSGTRFNVLLSVEVAVKLVRENVSMESLMLTVVELDSKS